MKKILDYLQQLDFSQTEARIYLTLLESGPMTVAQIAQTLQLNRTATYPYITSLLDKGVIAEILQGSRKQLTAADPEQLHYLLEKKEDSLQTLKTKFPDILTTIETAITKTNKDKKVEVNYYKGKTSAIKIYKEALKANELRSYVKIVDTGGIFSNNVKIFNEAFKQNPKLKIMEIIYDSPFATKDAQQVSSKNKGYNFKLMPKNIKSDTEDMLIYDGKVVIINYSGDIDTVVLKSINHYRNTKELFNFMWQTLPEPTI